jgi:hypothetical protein
VDCRIASNVRTAWRHDTGNRIYIGRFRGHRIQCRGWLVPIQPTALFTGAIPTNIDPNHGRHYPDRYWLVARDKAGLLTHMMRFLAGNARVSFEGNLSRCQFPQAIGSSGEEDSILRRQTIWPRQDFIVLPLEHDTIRPILEVVLPENRYLGDIVHIQIEKDTQLQFGSYDQFDHNCIVCFLGVPPKFLDELQERGIIRSWTTPYEGATRWHG